MSEFLKCKCPHCGQTIEFDSAESGRSCDCPNCNGAFQLPLATAQLVSATPPVVPQPQYVVVATPPRKTHGVFYYVFWGVVSLIATVFILWVIMAILGVGLLSALSGASTKAQRIVEREKAKVNQDKRNYITNFLTLYDFGAKYRESAFDGKVPGVEFKLKNTGDRTLNEVEVGVYFKDRFGKTICEKKYHPVLVTSFGIGNNEPLKPGYIWQDREHFYSAKEVPSEWREGSAEAVITDIEFADSKK